MNDSEAENRKGLLTRLCVECTCELFRVYDLELDYLEADTVAEIGAFASCGVIGFNGDGIRGTLRIAATRKALEDTAPVADGGLDDWLGELANQLLGRIKRRLHAAGGGFEVTTPLTMDGSWVAEVPDCPSPDEGLMRFSAAPGAAVCVWFDTNMPISESDLGPPSEVEGDAPAEGDLLFF